MKIGKILHFSIPGFFLPLLIIYFLPALIFSPLKVVIRFEPRRLQAAIVHTLAPHCVWCTPALAGGARGAGVDDCEASRRDTT
jgi:hypothetical protein